MAGLLYAGITRVFKEQGIMPQRGGQPLHPIQLCKLLLPLYDIIAQLEE
jgi:hypothetical protein